MASTKWNYKININSSLILIIWSNLYKNKTYIFFKDYLLLLFYIISCGYLTFPKLLQYAILEHHDIKILIDRNLYGRIQVFSEN